MSLLPNSNLKKICPNCGFENSNSAFWCKKCNTKLTQGFSNDEIKIKKEDIEKQKIEELKNYNRYLSKIEIQKTSQNFNFSFLKLSLIIIAIIVICLICFYFISNFEGFVGSPKDNIPYLSSNKNNNQIKPSSYSVDSDIIGEFNKDYWFEGSKIKTDYYWTFTIETVKEDYTLDGIILDIKTYDIDDYEKDKTYIISPVDLFIGVEDVKDNPENYPFTTSSFTNREIIIQYSIQNTNKDYFDTHVGNNHIIPHNQQVFNKLKNLKTFDKIIIKGDLVNIYGKFSRSNVDWLTDTKIGNSNCEIILINQITVQ